jgi:hypothetical protein
MSEMSREKAIKLAKKLKALADRGVEGERDNARERLEKLLKEYGLEEYQLSDTLKTFERTTLNEGSVILERIIKFVKPDAQINIKTIKTKIIIEVELTDIEHRQIKQRYKFFWRAYNRERSSLLTAFFNVHISEFTSSSSSYSSSSSSSYSPSNKNSVSGNIVERKINDTDKEASTQSSFDNNNNNSNDGFRGKPLTAFQEEKVRRYMASITKLDYNVIKDMKDSENASDTEYK